MTVHLIRKGHLGDVIMTEPVARALKASNHEVVLVTEYDHVAPYLPTYDRVEPYSSFAIRIGANDLDPEHFIVLAYENYPELHYLDGLAKCAQVTLADRTPRIRGGFAAPIAGKYCVIAPHTSSWNRGMREWSYFAFCEVARLLRSKYGIAVFFLKPEHSFEEMFALIEHCSLFIGNDSGPGIIAQAYSRPSLIIFGATDYSKVLFSPNAFPLWVDVGCNGCRQRNRNSRVECNTPICLECITSELVIKNVARLAKLE